MQQAGSSFPGISIDACVWHVYTCILAEDTCDLFSLVIPECRSELTPRHSLDVRLDLPLQPSATPSPNTQPQYPEDQNMSMALESDVGGQQEQLQQQHISAVYGCLVFQTPPLRRYDTHVDARTPRQRQPHERHTRARLVCQRVQCTGSIYYWRYNAPAC